MVLLKTIKIIKIILIVIGVMIGLALLVKLFGGASSKATANSKYLPKKANKYDAICVQDQEVDDNLNLEIIVGIDGSNMYATFDMVYILSKKDGTAIKETEEAKESSEELKKNLSAKSYRFVDGKVIFESSGGDMSTTKTFDIKEKLSSQGFTCK